MDVYLWVSLVIFFVGEAVCVFSGFDEVIAVEASPELVDFVSVFVDEVRAGTRIGSVCVGLVCCTEGIVYVVGEIGA
jgi:hypothetical protein